MYRCVALLSLQEPDADRARLASRDGRRAGRQHRRRTSGRAARRPRRERGDPHARGLRGGLARGGRSGRARGAASASSARCSRSGDWVAEGRDIGTVVAPEAELKVFLTADARERARRRARELGARTPRPCWPSRRCATSATAPASTAPAAGRGRVVIDTSGLTVEEVVDRIAALVRARANRQAMAQRARQGRGPRGPPDGAVPAGQADAVILACHEGRRRRLSERGQVLARSTASRARARRSCTSGRASRATARSSTASGTGAASR